MWIAIGAAATAVVGFGAWAGVIAFPQVFSKGKRYKKVKHFRKGGVKMIAHRGLSGLVLENTVPAFELAGQKSYYGIETDVHVTKDGKYITTHDDDMLRIAGLDMVIEETDYDVLRTLRFKDIYGNSEEENMYLPSLEEYINICKKYDKQAVLELKNKMEPQDVLGIAASIEKLGWLERTTFIAFSRENLLALRGGYPTADAQLLTEKVTEDDVQFMIKNHLGADLRWDCVRRKLIDRLHREGLKVNCWTVNGRECARWIKNCGIDFITSNILE